MHMISSCPSIKIQFLHFLLRIQIYTAVKFTFDGFVYFVKIKSEIFCI